MTIIDILLIILILTGAAYLFYRSFFKKKGCASCSVEGCQLKNIKNKIDKKNKKNYLTGVS